jgi:hypothetical protein
VPCFLVGKNAKSCVSWLASLGVSRNGTFTRGAGWRMRLTNGRGLSRAISGQALTPQEIIARTKALCHAGG